MQYTDFRPLKEARAAGPGPGVYLATVSETDLDGADFSTANLVGPKLDETDCSRAKGLPLTRKPVTIAEGLNRVKLAIISLTRNIRGDKC